MIDLHSRRLAGWAIADHMRTELVHDALSAAQRTRGSLHGALMHTDTDRNPYRPPRCVELDAIQARVGTVQPHPVLDVLDNGSRGARPERVARVRRERKR
ncbi:hypothetical protein Vau01_095220 [Virgisporangium aurantiacum]|uniref:Integrase core domain-containing protein n=1 Tax=Virgisporangium aurantiacum TaxID=175570 RepID=A0A8J4E582_9ACTN|nr:hypothetical protein Vau01_095220 [Virgisporangium aurantiacum]